MAQSVKLGDEIMAAVRRESALQSRSVAGQITHWINIGRAIERSGSFDYARINEVLAGAVSPDALTAEEQEVWFERFAEVVADPSADETAFFEERKRLGRGVGLNQRGELTYSADAAE